MLSRLLGPASIVRVQSWDCMASPPPALDQILGTPWPRDVGAVASALADALCVGPTQWLVIGGDAGEREPGQGLRKALMGSSFRATDVSQALARIEIEGAGAREALLEGCSLDLHPDRFPMGRCATTRFASVPLVLRRRAPWTFEAIVAVSYREYLLTWIADAATSPNLLCYPPQFSASHPVT
jgi:sarcosine oxidase, subunit gamma